MTRRETSPTVPQRADAASQSAPRKDWRGSYASAVLIGVLVLGFLVLTPNIYFESTPWLTLVFFAAYAAVGAVIAWRGSVSSKIGLSVVVLGASGIAAILGGHSPANGTFFFVALVTIVTLLRSPRSGAFATGITLVVVAAVAGLSAAGLLGAASADETLRAPAGWIGAALAVLLFGAALALGISHLQRNVGPPVGGEVFSAVDEPPAAAPIQARHGRDRGEWLQKALETGQRLSSIDDADGAAALTLAVRDAFGYPDVAAFVLNAAGDTLTCASRVGDAAVAQDPLTLDGDSLTAQAVRAGAAQISHQPSGLVDGDVSPSSTGPATMALPIMRHGRALAALQVRARGTAGFEPDEIEALKWVAGQAALVMRLSRTNEATAPGSAPKAPPQPRSLTHPWRRMMGEGAIEYEFGDRELPESAPEIKVPLSLRDEEIGTISLAADANWSAEEQSLVEAVATQAALALDNARLMEASQLAASREHTLADITAKVWGATTLDGVLRTAIQELAQAFGADRGIIELRTGTDDDN